MLSPLLQVLAASGSGTKPDNLTEAEYLEELGRLQFQGKETSTLGPIVFGFGLDMLLCGVMVHQVVQWASNYREERLFNRIITLCVIAPALAQTSLNIFYVWSLFIVGFGYYTEMLKLDKITVFLALAVATTVPVQIFFLERAYRLLHKPWWFIGVMAPPMLMSIMGGLACPIVATTLPSFLDVSGISKWLYVWGVGTVAADLLLTGFMMYGLSRNKTGWSNTDKFINRLIRAAIETQVPGTLFGVAFVISMSIQIVSYGNIMLEMFHSKVYVVCLLAVLNYRYTLRKDMSAGSGHHEDGRTRENTFALRSRGGQADIPLDRIQVETVIQRTSYEMPEDKKGINRARFPDDESGRSENLDADEYSSTVILTADGREQ